MIRLMTGRSPAEKQTLTRLADGAQRAPPRSSALRPSSLGSALHATIPQVFGASSVKNFWARGYSPACPYFGEASRQHTQRRFQRCKGPRRRRRSFLRLLKPRHILVLYNSASTITSWYVFTPLYAFISLNGNGLQRKVARTQSPPQPGRAEEYREPYFTKENP